MFEIVNGLALVLGPIGFLQNKNEKIHFHNLPEQLFLSRHIVCYCLTFFVVLFLIRGLQVFL